jgi:outer membrane protein TolC
MRGNNPVYVFGALLTQQRFTATNFALESLNAPLPLDNFRTQLAATLPLYDAGQTAARIRAARLDSRAAEQAQHRTSQEVIFNVVTAYLNELLARDSVRVAEAAVGMAKADVERARNRQNEGLAVASDLLSAQVQLAQAREDLVRARNAVEVAHAGLNVAMGVPEDDVSEIQGLLSGTTFEPGTLAARQQQAVALRPDYRESSLAGEKAKSEVTAARTAFLPKFSLFGTLEQDRETFAGHGGNNWMAGASLNFNLFAGGSDRYRLAEARAREHQAGAQHEQMAAMIRLQVREAFLNLAAARERQGVSRDAVSQAVESLRILRNRYESGLATITDLLRAEIMQTTAEKNQLNATYDYRLASAALELATGELSPDSPAVAH